ncbi:RICIN domain-containing protein [Streptomyces sp. NBC_01294]|uniref:RICIN domain-containing protein n=1 Tax=Streptomyces sp. NBC_01294 TaxID=2903815 RepID=UPI002DDC753C|nr:RICIN domain-containing protein [Streptomyces sp. NBC_01294]WRZ56725.1 XRE family transcriptional regulator [Streptomyces sp. NBC_01294]
MAGVDGQHTSPGKQLGSALKALQQRSGRTLRSLESEVMISDSSLSRYLRGSTVPPWATVRDLCRALDADPADYRVLWEAADRCQPKPPAGAGGAPVPESRWRRRWRLAGVRLRSRWAWAAAGAFAGLLLGAALARFFLATDSAPGQAPSKAPAQAQPPTQTQTAGGKARHGAPGSHDVARIFVNRATGNCLDHSLDQGLRSFAPNGMSYQRWTVHPHPDGTSELRNHATGACLDSSGSGLRTSACSAAASQKWLLTAWDDESVQVSSRSTGACLDDSGGAGLRALPCDRSDHQKWG